MALARSVYTVINQEQNGVRMSGFHIARVNIGGVKASPEVPKAAHAQVVRGRRQWFAEAKRRLAHLDKFGERTE
jgi:hypothetical protein